MSRKKCFMNLAVICIMVLLLSGCGGASALDFSDASEAKKALNNASVVYIAGKLENPNQTGDILADGKVAGYLKETGLFNTRWTISIDGKTWFYMKFVTDEPINDVEGEITATTYGYYDSDDNCLGYAQERVLETENVPRDYYLVFLDADGNPREYFAVEDGSSIYDYEGNKIGTGAASSDSILTDKCHVEIETDEDSGIQVEFMDKMAMYIVLFKDLNDWYMD